MANYQPPASPAEAAVREPARAAKLQQLHATLTEQVSAIRTGEDWQRWLQVAARFPSYSLNNLLLIAAQRPDATAVAGFGAWKALGRQVDKGAKGIAILAPILRRPTTADPPGEQSGGGGQPAAGRNEAALTGSQAGGDAAGPDQRPAGLARGGVGGFKVVHVFDIADTNGQPLPVRPVPALLTGQAPEGLWAALTEQVLARGFTVHRGDCGAANGLTNYLHRTVTVRPGVDDAQAVKTLAHELGHVLLHTPAPATTGAVQGAAGTAADPAWTPETVGPSAEQCRGRLEVEAESLAYLVASTHGLDTRAYTFRYVAGWASEVGDAGIDEVVRSTANRVLAAARIVLAGTEHLLERPGDTPRLEQSVTLPAAATSGTGRTAALLTTSEATAQSTAQIAANNNGTAPAAVATAAGLADRPASAAAGPTAQRLLEVQTLAVEFYASRLHAGGPDGRRAIDLLTGRGVDRDSATAAQLGYAPRGWTTLVDHLRTAGVGDVELKASGLVLESARGTLVDRFRDRIIFPVQNLDGQTVALLGRAVNETATDRSGNPIPKYVNSPETAIYRKGKHLYGLGQAAEAIANGATAVLVEGPMDVLAINRAAATSPVGMGPAHFGVAACGTALTVEQVRLLDTVTGGLAERGIVAAFDGDEAGRRASLRSYGLLRQVGAWPTALDLPAGQDPASLVLEHGTAGLRAALLASASKPLADLVVDDRITRHNLRWVEGQLAAGRDATAVVATMPPEQVSRQIMRIVAQTKLGAGTVSDLLTDAVTAPSRQPGDNAGQSQPPTRRPGPAGSTPEPASAAPPAAKARARSAQSSQTAPQRARAGFPVDLATSLRPPPPPAPDPAPSTLGSPADHRHRSRTA